MTDGQILQLAKSCGFEEFIGEKDDETDGIYYQFWEEQLLKFAWEIYGIAADETLQDYESKF